jgi:hypothetical protein
MAKKLPMNYALLPAGEKDSTSDIPQMSRTDNVWSICFSYCIANTLAILYRSGLRSSELNIFHDPKQLKEAHWQAILQTIRSNIVSIFTEGAETLGSTIDYFAFNRIEEVRKPKPGVAPDSRQAGVVIADYLCGKIDDLVDGVYDSLAQKRIFVRDHTDTVVRTLNDNWPLR